MVSNPDDMETPQAFVPEKPKCFLCQKDIKFEKKFQKHSDDAQIDDDVEFSKDFCIYCRRYICPEC